jgi:prepilin-type N-terminal cleavage/methylation domain-containing protein
MGRRQGFTLIDLSIVLVIIALIVAGVLIGKDMIEVASMRKQVGYVEKIKTATNTFRLKYGCLPGDCSRATSIFGRASIAPNCPTNSGANVTSEGTCDGNGDGAITSYLVQGNNNAVETLYFMQQMSASHLASWPWQSAPPYITLPLDSFLATKQYLYAITSPATLWPNASTNIFTYWKIDAVDSRDAALVGYLDLKYDDGNGMTGNIKVQYDDLEQDSTTTCIEYPSSGFPSGEYRMNGATTGLCYVVFDFI